MTQPQGLATRESDGKQHHVLELKAKMREASLQRLIHVAKPLSVLQFCPSCRVAEIGLQPEIQQVEKYGCCRRHLNRSGIAEELGE